MSNLSMGRGSSLTNVEIGKIEALHEEGFSNRCIAGKIGRSKDVVNRFLHNPLGYGTAERSGRPSKLDARDKRRILRRASNTASSSSTIQRELQLNVTPRTVRNVINASPNIVRARMRKAPALTEAHKARRLQFAENNMNRDWSKVSIFKVYRIFYGFTFFVFRSSGLMKNASNWTDRTASMGIGTISGKIRCVL